MNETASETPEAEQKSQPTGNRKQRRALEKIHSRKKPGRKGGSGSGKVDVGALAQTVEQLTRQSEATRKAFNTNHLAYSQAIGAADGHIAVLRAVLNDIVRGEVKLDADGSIEWNTYYQWYNEHLEEEKAQAAAAPSEEAAEGGIEVVQGMDIDEELFGGDYNGNGIRQVPEGEHEAPSTETE